MYTLKGDIVQLCGLKHSSSAHESHLDSGGLVEGGADRAELDVGEDDAGVGELGLDLSGDTGGGCASTTGDTGLFGVGGGGVGRVEPQHVDAVVVPERHDEHVSARKRRTHTVHAAEVGKRRDVAEG